MIHEKYAEKESSIKAELDKLNDTITSSIEKKKSAESVKSIGEKSTTPGDQIKLKEEYEKLTDEANQQELTATTKKQKLISELEKIQDDKSSEVTEVDNNSKKQVQEVIQKQKLQEAKNKQAKSKLEEKSSESKKVVLTKEIEAEKLIDHAIDMEINETKDEIEQIEEITKELQEEKNIDEDFVSNIDGGAAIEVVKEVALTKSITDLSTKIVTEKTTTATKIATNTAEVTKATVEKEELEVVVEEKKKELEAAKGESQKHKVQIQEAINSLENNSKNTTAQKSIELLEEQVSTDKKIIEATDKSLDKVVKEESQIAGKIENLNNDTIIITKKTEDLEIELTNEIAGKTEKTVEKTEEKAIDDAIVAKEKALESKLDTDTQKEIASSSKAAATQIQKKVKISSEKHTQNIATSTKQIIELTTKQKEITIKVTSDPKQKVKDIAKITQQITAAQEKIADETEKQTIEEAEVVEAQEVAATESAKVKTLETKSKVSEKIYKKTVTSNKVTDDAELVEVKAKNTAAKTAAKAAITAADKIKGDQSKVIDATKNKIKTCESKIKEADGNLKTLFAQRVEINNQMSKATPKELAKGTFVTLLATVQASIVKNEAVIEEMTICVTAGVTEQSAAREKIVEIKEAANEA